MTKLFFPLLAFFLSLCCLLPVRAQRASYDDIDVEQVKKLQMAQIAIASLYVDSVDQKKLTEDAIRGMISKLDPHSSYNDPKETKRLTEPLTGNFEGIGVSFNIVKDTLLVLQVVSKGPCEKVGIMAGDRIIAVNDEKIAGVKMDRDSIMSRLRGPKGTIANLQVVRRGATDVLDFKVVRDKIPVYTVDAAYMIQPGIGYIRLDSFGATSADEIEEKIKRLKKEGMKDLILDLCANGGGYLNAAQDVASQFLSAGSMIVYTDGRVMPRQELKAEGTGLMRDGSRLVVLVDEFSASAAEIVSGAIQDHDRGLIVGRRTFGKGLVQRPIDLPDGSMIRLTVSHYYTPSGRCIQKPYVKGSKEDYDKDLEERYTRGELTSIDSIHLDSTQVYRTLTKHRTVYGGGGIMPDVFVPLDTTALTPCFRSLRRYNLINDYTLRYVDEHRKEIKRNHKSFDSFARAFEVPAELIDSVLAEGKRKKIEPKDEKERQKTIDELRFAFKTTIAYDLWDRNEYFRLLNERNDILKRALNLFKEEERWK